MPQGVHLQLRQLLNDLRALDLEYRDFRPRRPRFARHRRQHPQVRDLERHQLELHLQRCDRESAHPRISGRPFTICRRCHLFEAFQVPFAIADAGVVGALVAEQKFGVGPALVLLADQVVHRHLHIVEEDVVDLVLAIERDDRAYP